MKPETAIVIRLHCYRERGNNKNSNNEAMNRVSLSLFLLFTDALLQMKHQTIHD